jgi:hypothetical protein
MYAVRQILGIPNWNAERAKIYAKITDAEAEERLQRLLASLPLLRALKIERCMTI